VYGIHSIRQRSKVRRLQIKDLKDRERERREGDQGQECDYVDPGDPPWQSQLPYQLPPG
jgi:hypothetical protein